MKLITYELLQMCLKSYDFMQLANTMPSVFTIVNNNKNYIAFYILQHYKFKCKFLLAYRWYAAFVKYNINMTHGRTWLCTRAIFCPDLVALLHCDKGRISSTLLSACANNDIQHVKSLLFKDRVCPVERDNFALPAALLQCNFNLAALLCTYSITEPSYNTDLQTVLCYAVAANCCSVVRMLLEFTHLNLTGLLQIATKHSHIENMLLCDPRTVELLLTPDL